MTNWASIAADLLRQEPAPVRDERRSFDRIEAPPRTSARVITDRQNSRTVALVKDLSITGVGLTLGLELAQGQFAIIELTSGDRTQLILSRISHCHRLDEGLYQAGVEFFDELPPSSDPASIPPDWLAYLPPAR